MYLQKIKLWNFRKFGSNDEFNLLKPNLNLDFTSGLNVLIGEIILDDSAVEEPAHFQIYRFFKEAESISAHFSSEIQENIWDKLKIVDKERRDHDIPGFYFPFDFKTDPSFFNLTIKKGWT